MKLIERIAKRMGFERINSRDVELKETRRENIQLHKAYENALLEIQVLNNSNDSFSRCNDALVVKLKKYSQMAIAGSGVEKYQPLKRKKRH